MTAFQSYRRLLSSFLLAIYLVVIAPVQIWHSHNAEAATDNEIHWYTSQETVNSHTDGLMASDCQACSHHYALHFEEMIFQTQQISSVFIRKYADVVQQIHCASLFLSANKGPPAA